MSDLFFENKCDDCGKQFEDSEPAHIVGHEEVMLHTGGYMVKGNETFPDPVRIENNLVLICNQCWGME